MEHSRISVIIPVYNAKATLEDAVRSCLGQTLPPREIILVDDGSDDGSAQLCDQIGQTEASVKVLHIPPLGVSAARNRGLDEAAGDAVTFLDADDTMASGMLECLDAVLYRTGADYAGCGFGDAEQTGSGEDTVSEFAGSDIILQRILRHDTSVWGKLYRRRFLGETRFREGLTIGEDMLFVLSLLREDTVFAFTGRKLYRYTINPAGAMERPFVPSYMDQISCWQLARETALQNFPALAGNPEAQAGFSSVIAVSAVLTASKIAKLGQQGRQYDSFFAQCRGTVRDELRLPGARQALPGDYKVKAVLLTRFPRLYRLLYVPHSAGSSNDRQRFRKDKRE